jgi:ribosomal protein L11 methylase PrmA
LKIAYANIGVEAACGSTTDESAVKHSFAQAEVRFGNLDFSK